MENKDTVNLLKECDSGSKMAVSTIDEVLEKTTEPELKELLNKSKAHHTKIGNELHKLLVERGSDEKEPNAMAKGMSWIKTNVMLTMKDNDKTIADLVTDGCNMGIKSLYRYLNQYTNAESFAKKICNQLIDIEESLRQDLRCYL